MAFDQKQYIKDFNKRTYKMFAFRVRKDDEAVIDKLNGVTNLNKYLRELIEKDIKPSILTIKQIKEKAFPVFQKHQIKEIYLFGSYARGEAKNTSDIDIYCESGGIRTLIEQGSLEDELESALGKEVDIVFIGSQMNDYFREQLEKDKIKLC